MRLWAHNPAAGGMLMPQNDFEINIPQINFPSFSRKTLLAALGIAVLIWFASGLYKVEADELGVVLRFGRIHACHGVGLELSPPVPDRIGRDAESDRGQAGRDRFPHAWTPALRRRTSRCPQESLMLTGDENIVDIDMIVQFRIKDPAAYLFKVRNVGRTVQAAAEASCGR